MMPAYFFAHGAPSLVIEDHAYTQYLKSFASTLPARPKGIVLFSAHYESPVQEVGAPETYGTVYDFSGFPDELYQMTYPAPGAPELAAEIAGLLSDANVPSRLNAVRGLDHGAWAVLKLIFPEADIPVVALSVNRHRTNREQYELGRAIGQLRERDILVIGSGGVVHNLRRISWGAGPDAIAPWALEFDRWMEERLTAWNTEELFQYEQLAPHAELAVPTNEHFIPLLLAMGSADADRQARLLHRSYQWGSLSLTAWQFG
ncbi:dioxygenase family protein [Gorillibacterium sp. sgz500922]|uniref:dioxygenase family protein n=1 Tax=Gorillibacterium sp. sgz500922 TaxID=3446694 RepID=UPI003F679066